MAGWPQAPRQITNNVLQGNILETFDCTPKTIYDNMDGGHEMVDVARWASANTKIKRLQELPASYVFSSPSWCTWKVLMEMSRLPNENKCMHWIISGQLCSQLRENHHDDVLLDLWG